jgi:hypothetical protein
LKISDVWGCGRNKPLLKKNFLPHPGSTASAGSVAGGKSDLQGQAAVSRQEDGKKRINGIITIFFFIF